jgi:hypothetical protein
VCLCTCVIMRVSIYVVNRLRYDLKRTKYLATARIGASGLAYDRITRIRSRYDDRSYVRDARCCASITHNCLPFPPRDGCKLYSRDTRDRQNPLAGLISLSTHSPVGCGKSHRSRYPSVPRYFAVSIPP